MAIKRCCRAARNANYLKVIDGIRGYEEAS